MTHTIVRPRVTAASVFGHTVLVLPAALLLNGSLGLGSPAPAQAVPQLKHQGSHGAHRFVRPPQPQVPTVHSVPQPEVQAPQSPAAVEERRQAPIFVQQGSHGASRVVDQEGVGGPQGSGDYRGFPRLERRGTHGAYRVIND